MVLSWAQEQLYLFTFYFTSGYTKEEVQENQEGMELNGTHQLLVYTDNVKQKQKYHKNTNALLDTSKDSVLEVNAEKMKYMFMSHH
jgi:hypothetical protein